MFLTFKLLKPYELIMYILEPQGLSDYAVQVVYLCAVREDSIVVFTAQGLETRLCGFKAQSMSRRRLSFF
jgi:hypothetical protein